MKLKNYKVEQINNNMRAKKTHALHADTLGVNINACVNDTAEVYKGNWHICAVEDLGLMIEELQMMKEAIEEETGVII